ncbi:MAG: hypothetical protein IMW98_01065 [Firmicutes bacterium]|nr:hypothetical protein [Bacillota bacterium]
MFERILAVDVETTGLDPAEDEILQVGAVLWEEGRVAARLSRLCRPRRPVPLAVLRLTGLAEEELRRAPPVEEALAALEDLRREAGGALLCAHNAPFDLAFLRAAAGTATSLASGTAGGLTGPTVDTLEWARLLWPSGGHDLAGLVERIGGPGFAAHDALADAEATAWLYGCMVHRAAAAPPGLKELWRRLLAPVDPLFLEFLETAPQLAARCMDAARGADVAWRRAVARGDREAPPQEPAGEGARRDPSLLPGGRWQRRAVVSAFARGGALSRALPSFEWRAGQAEMADRVARALEGGGVAVLEAGTGTGKSLAYLLPAAAWAAAHGERVVVSTHTLALQEQLLQKDLPVVRAVLPADFAAQVVKGQSHYLCLRRWDEILEGELALGEAERRFLARVAAWLETTAEGDRAELHLREAEEAGWAALSVEEHACAGRRCPRHDDCFLMAARRRAEAADVLVVNHALLLADVRTGGGVLPAYTRLVVDEAHHLEDLAAEHLGEVFERGAWLRRLAEVGRPRDRSTLAGRLRERWRGREAEAALRAVEAQAQAAAAAVEALFQAAAAGLGAPPGAAAAAGAGAVEGAPSAGGAREWRLDGAPPGDARVARLREAAEEAAAAFLRLAGALAPAAAAFDGAADDRGAAIGAEARRTAELFQEGAASLQRIVRPREGWAAWVESDGRRWALRAAPVDAGALLREALFARVASAVLTSATLSVAGRLEPFTRRVGLDALGERVEAATVASPFAYREQALVAVPTDLPRVPQREDAAYWDRVVPFLERLLLASGGRALLLFTSHRALRQAYQRLRAPLERAGIQALAQGLDGSRWRLLDALRRDPRTAVFGAASFWEGVDVPGENLQLVVVARLPFRPPGHPLGQARAEAVAARGGDPFSELALPEAVLRFKQGFGRLIRSRDDRGAVVVLDDRLLRTAYGRAFLRSLPGASGFAGSQADVVRAVLDWLSGRRSASDFAPLGEDADE